MEVDWVIDGCTVAELLEISEKEETNDEKYFNIKRRAVEAQAEKEGAIQHRQWMLDHVCLEDAIDDALKEYGELHRSAHAVRLQLEHERSELMKEVRAAANSSTKYAQSITHLFPRSSTYNSEQSDGRDIQDSFEYFLRSPGENDTNATETKEDMNNFLSLQRPSIRKRYKAPAHKT